MRFARKAGGSLNDRPARCWLEHPSKASGRRDHGGRPGVDGVDDLRAIDPLQVNGRDPEVRMPEMALDNDQRHALMRQLDSVRMAELMGGANRRRTPALGR
jgi:hypothetical protein